MTTVAALTEAGTSKTIRAGGVNLHYHEAGQGDPVLLLHAYGPGTTAWVQFSKNVDTLSQHFRCIMLDLPNSGKSELLAPLPDEPGHHTMARSALLLLDALGIEKAHLVGNSMGGTTCLVIAIDHPERVNRLVVGGCHASTGGDPYLIANRPSEGSRATREATQNPTKDNLRRYLQVHLDNQALVTDELVDYIHQSHMRLAQREGAPAAGGTRVLHSNMADLPKIKSPTLIIHGRYDRMVTVEQGLMIMNYIPDSRLVVFNHCGHWPPYEYPEEYNAQVVSFLQGY